MLVTWPVKFASHCARAGGPSNMASATAAQRMDLTYLVSFMVLPFLLGQRPMSFFLTFLARRNPPQSFPQVCFLRHEPGSPTTGEIFGKGCAMFSLICRL